METVYSFGGAGQLRRRLSDMWSCLWATQRAPGIQLLWVITCAGWAFESALPQAAVSILAKTHWFTKLDLRQSWFLCLVSLLGRADVCVVVPSPQKKFLTWGWRKRWCMSFQLGQEPTTGNTSGFRWFYMNAWAMTIIMPCRFRSPRKLPSSW